MSDDGLTFPLLPRRRVAGLSFGAMRSRTRGSGLDLAGARPYHVGDDIRRIDWRASARLSSARDDDEFVVREHLTEEATRVVILVDRSPSMALFPPDTPWLSKPVAIAEAGSLILASALRAGCLVGYLDDADGRHEDPAKRAESPFWRPPTGTTESWRVRERYLAYDGFAAAERAIERGLDHLLKLESPLPAGTFVFVLSDYLDGPSADAWEPAVARGWDIVPVVVQDPTWEQSFPDVAGAIVPYTAAGTGDTQLVRLSRREVAERRARHEARRAELVQSLLDRGLDPVLLSSAAPGDVLGAFMEWALGRHQGARLAR